MQGLTGKKKFSFQSRSPIRLDELQVTIFVRAVDFVADNWVSEVGEVYANLVGSAGFRFGFYEGKLLLLVLEPVQDPERSKGWMAERFLASGAADPRRTFLLRASRRRWRYRFCGCDAEKS